jgi:hypothetical protein
MSIVLNGQKIETPGVETVSWLDDPAVPQATDRTPRTMWVRAVVVHSVHGKVGVLKPGIKPSTRAEAYAKYQANTSRDVSWDYTIDTDGTVVVSNDPVKFYTWHATSVNPFTLGIEFVQDDDGALYEGQMEAGVKFLDTLTRLMSENLHPIQRQVPVGPDGKPVRGVIPRIVDVTRAKNFSGILGHRNQTTNRGTGDPGDHIFNALLKAGYKGFHLDADDDILFWKNVQSQLGVHPVDGVPGKITRDALLKMGHKHGLWVARPGD